MGLPIAERIFINRYQTITVTAYCFLSMLPGLIFPHPVALLPLAMIPLGLLLILKKPFIVVLIFILFSF